jgi:hypothetical protein
MAPLSLMTRFYLSRRNSSVASRMSLRHTMGSRVGLDEHRVMLSFTQLRCGAVGIGASRCHARRSGCGLRGGEDPGLVLMMRHVLPLEETVHAVNLQLQPIDLLLQHRATCLRFSMRHLQRNQPLLGVLLHFLDTLLQAATATPNGVLEANLHLLQFLKH